MPEQTVWKKVLSELELEVSPAVFNTMFKQTQLSDLTNDVATIAVSSIIIQQLIETRYYALIKKIMDRHLGKNTSILFSIDSSLKKPGGGQKSMNDLGPLFQTPTNDFSLTLKKHRVRSDYTFETFAVSPSNQLAFAAATHVGANPGDSYNPFFLYGGVGVGKTHLMHGVAHAVLLKNPDARIVICAGEDFTNEIIEAIRTRTTPTFRNKFRRAQLLAIDDIQFIAGKETVQEEFFHTFNAILREGGQVILTSDRPPSEIPKLEDRIRSRLEGGLIVDIAPPDFELRVAIFLIKAKARNIDFPVELAKIVATAITDTRGLEGFLTRIIGEMQFKNTSVSQELVLHVLGKKYVGDVEPLVSAVHFSSSAKPTKDAFIDAVCNYFHLKQTQIKGAKRDQSLALPRQILMYLLRTELSLALVEIGSLIGGRDHTTVIHAVSKISTLVSTNEKVREDILNVKKLIYG